jgi:hypothetical protein
MQYLSTSDYVTIALYFALLIGMQALIRSWSAFGITIALHCVSLIAMYFVWYRHLPKDEPDTAALTQTMAVAAEGAGLP